MSLSEYKRFMEALNLYNESYDLAFEDAMADKLKDLLGDDYYKNVYIPFKNKIASKVKIGEDEDGKPIMGENPDLKLKQPKYLLDTYSDNPQELKDLIDNYKTKSDEIKDAKKGAKYLGENGEYKCYFVFTYPAAKYYGENTTWCITGRYKGAESQGEEYFNDYIRDENLDGGYYFFLHKTNPRRKYALLQQVDKKDKKHPLKIHSVWSALNSPLTLDRLPIFPMVKEIPELKDVYKDVDIENSDHIKDRDRKSLEHDILISCRLPEENFKDAVRNVKEILEGDDYKDYNFDINNIKDNWGETPLYLACISNNTELIKLLLEHGADPNIKYRFPSTPLDFEEESLLHYFCREQNAEVTKLLLEHGVDINVRNENGETPLSIMCSIFRPNLKLVELLLEHGADPNISSKSGKYPLLFACLQGNIKLIKLLLKYGADINIVNGYDLLTDALYDIELVKLLLEHGADKFINVKNENGFTPFFYSCTKGFYEVAKLLIEHGADVNIQNKYGHTPLDLACTSSKYNPKSIKIVKLLLEHGAGNDLDVNNLPDYITKNKQIEDLVLSYLNKNKERNESIRLRRLYRL